MDFDEWFVAQRDWASRDWLCPFGHVEGRKSLRFAPGCADAIPGRAMIVLLLSSGTFRTP
jgi:hypothetical protein